MQIVYVLTFCVALSRVKTLNFKGLARGVSGGLIAFVGFSYILVPDLLHMYRVIYFNKKK
jgi:hypothetical protein